MMTLRWSFVLCLKMMMWMTGLKTHTSTSVLAAIPDVSDLTDVLTLEAYSKENECSSTLGLSMAMDLLYPSMMGAAARQTKQRFGYTQNDRFVYNATIQALEQTYSGDGQEGQCNDPLNCATRPSVISISNIVFVDGGGISQVNETYRKAIGDQYFQALNFSDPSAGDVVNDWVNETSRGLIDSIVDNGPLTPYVVLALNTIYLKAQWAIPFFATETNLDNFYASPDRSSIVNDKAHFLHQVEFHLYSDTAIPGMQILKLPFVEGTLSLVLALPMVEANNNTTMMSFAYSDVLDALPQLKNTRVALALPKVAFDSEYDLKQPLMEIGLEAPFQGGLCIFQSSGCNVAIELVKQKTSYSMDEDGVEAAAVTVIAGVTSFPIDPPVLVLADNPFRFFIYEETQNVILFEGRIGNPEPPAGSPEPQLTKKHKDKDFWSSVYGVEPVLPNITTSPQQPIINNTPAPVSTPPVPKTAPPVAPAAETEAEMEKWFQKQHNFTDGLMTVLYDDINDCTSSLSISMAFSLLFPSMIGYADWQTDNVFGYPAVARTSLVWENTTADLETSYSGVCFDDACTRATPKLEIANSVWVNNNTVINTTNATSMAALDPAFVKVSREVLQAIDFSDPKAGSTINAWVNETTKGLINNIVNDGPLTGFLVIAINSIYLKATWAAPFQVTFTGSDAFYSSPAKVTVARANAHFMHQVEYFPYLYREDGFQILQLPFLGNAGSDSTLSMIIVLPTEVTGSNANPGARLNSTDVIRALPSMQRTRIALALPKFVLESTYQDDLKEALQTLGLKAPFYRGLCIYENDGCNNSIDLVIQKTYIGVDEDGVEAAAVTALISRTSLPSDTPVLFMADHPFQFFIYDETQELTIFEGRIVNPEPPSDSVPQLNQTSDKVHLDSDFWSSIFGVDPVPPSASVSAAANSGDSSSSARCMYHGWCSVIFTTSMLALLSWAILSAI
jgi:serine protease inhibitor